MKYLKFFLLFYLIFGVTSYSLENETKSKIVGKKNFLHEIETFNTDGSINVVIEIPAGENDKWEVSKQDGSLRRERSNNSFRVIKYLPYIGNYGFIPKTLQPMNIGGDGDPVDVILLGKRYERGVIVRSKVLGVMIMTDAGKIDNKVVAIPIDSKIFFHEKINSLNDLKRNYPGVLEILKIWFKNYKRTGQVEIQGYDNHLKAIEIIKTSQNPYEVLRGYWLERN
tara:strand:+ start:62 stop:736 length:675 start_codon:yes stop_codon:yes gene_type:complete